MLLPWTEALVDWGWRVVSQRPWQIALTGLTIGLESQPPEIYPPLVASFPKHYGWALEDKAIRFFAGHIEADQYCREVLQYPGTASGSHYYRCCGLSEALEPYEWHLLVRLIWPGR
jgi:hypothetical protein